MFQSDQINIELKSKLTREHADPFPYRVEMTLDSNPNQSYKHVDPIKNNLTVVDRSVLSKAQ